MNKIASPEQVALCKQAAMKRYSELGVPSNMAEQLLNSTLVKLAQNPSLWETIKEVPGVIADAPGAYANAFGKGLDVLKHVPGEVPGVVQDYAKGIKNLMTPADLTLSQKLQHLTKKYPWMLPAAGVAAGGAGIYALSNKIRGDVKEEDKEDKERGYANA